MNRAAVFATLVAAGSPAWAAGAACGNLTQLKLPHTQITDARG